MKILTDLMNNPIAWTVLAVIAILGIILSIYFYLKSKKKRKISFKKSTYMLVRNINEELKDLEIKYKNIVIENLSITKFAIWNDGNTKLENLDFASIMPFAIEAKKKSKVLNASILIKSEEANNFTIEMDTEKNKILIYFEYMDPKEGLVIQILHTGNADDLKLVGKIKSGKKIKNGEKDNGILARSIRKTFSILSHKIILKLYLLVLIIFISIYTLLVLLSSWGISKDINIFTESANNVNKWEVLILFLFLDLFLILAFIIINAEEKVPRKLKLYDRK